MGNEEEEEEGKDSDGDVNMGSKLLIIWREMTPATEVGRSRKS